MLSAVIALAVLALLASFGLAIAARVFAVETDPRIELVEDALPRMRISRLCGAGESYRRRKGEGRGLPRRK